MSQETSVEVTPVGASTPPSSVGKGASERKSQPVVLDRATSLQIIEEANAFALRYGLQEYQEAFHKGALAAQADQLSVPYNEVPGLDAADVDILEYEAGHRWAAYPKKLYFLCALCAGCAIVQGMDQTVINGAQMFYFDEFGITDKVMQGLINGSPYLAAAFVGCWLNAPLNNMLGRRGAIAFSCLFAFLTALWQAGAPNWKVFIGGRLALGLAVGAKSSTAPVYTAECAPKTIRGAMTMMWQMWTAFGIMLGFAVSVGFAGMDFMGEYSQWRWMIGVTAVPPMIVGMCVYIMPESPRWYMDRGDFRSAFMSMLQLRKHRIQAARDMFQAYRHLQAEEHQRREMTLAEVLRQFVKVRRIRRAAQSSWFCMFMQQFCGVNVIAYYSTKIFIDAGFSWTDALLVSLGIGGVNFLGAIPAIATIDKFGRRGLLLCTFPVMAICLFITGLGFQLTEGEQKLRLVATGIFIFMFVYSPGMGPVPFTYSAEAFPLHVRALGMSSATSITWGFNFLISFTWPKMMQAWTAQGAFYWYAGWNIFGWVFTFFLLPETKNKSLEELDDVFQMPNREHARWHYDWLQRTIAKSMGRDVPGMRPLYPDADTSTEKDHVSQEEVIVRG